MLRALLMLLLAFTLWPTFPIAPAFADRIDPDRPEVTESAKLVPRGSVQLETGVAVSKERQAGEPTEWTVVYYVTPRLALDTGIQASLLGEGPDYVVRAGLTTRFGR